MHIRTIPTSTSLQGRRLNLLPHTRFRWFAPLTRGGTLFFAWQGSCQGLYAEIRLQPSSRPGSSNSQIHSCTHNSGCSPDAHAIPVPNLPCLSTCRRRIYALWRHHWLNCQSRRTGNSGGRTRDSGHLTRTSGRSLGMIGGSREQSLVRTQDAGTRT